MDLLDKSLLLLIEPMNFLSSKAGISWYPIKKEKSYILKSEQVPEVEFLLEEINSIVSCTFISDRNKVDSLSGTVESILSFMISSVYSFFHFYYLSNRTKTPLHFSSYSIDPLKKYIKNVFRLNPLDALEVLSWCDNHAINSPGAKDSLLGIVGAGLEVTSFDKNNIHEVANSGIKFLELDIDLFVD